MSKDSYQTPREVFEALHAEFNFQLDAAASHTNALLPFYITEEQNTLETEWRYNSAADQDAGWYAWMNPPYSNISPFVARAAEMAKQGIGTVMLVMMDQSVGWYKEAVKTCQEVRLVIGGRLSFINPITGKPAAGNNKGSMFLIWHPFGRTPVQYSHIDRDEMLAAGRALLDQATSELASNPCQLPETELSVDALPLTCTSETAESETQPVLSAESETQAQPEQPLTDGAKAPELITVEFTGEQLAEQVASGKLPFDGDHLALMLQLTGMFGDKPSYKSWQVKAAVLAFDEPDIVSKVELQGAIA